MDSPLVLTILRLSHIFFGVVWVGFGLAGAFIIHPVADKLGEKGDMLLRNFYAYSNYNRVFPLAVIITTVAGLILWPLRTEGGMDFIGFTNTGDIVMSVGAIFGLLAFGHGAAATGRFSTAYAKAAQAYEEVDTPSDEQVSELAEARQKLYTHVNISTILSVIALVAMASARYI